MSPYEGWGRHAGRETSSSTGFFPVSCLQLGSQGRAAQQLVHWMRRSCGLQCCCSAAASSSFWASCNSLLVMAEPYSDVLFWPCLLVVTEPCSDVLSCQACQRCVACNVLLYAVQGGSGP